MQPMFQRMGQALVWRSRGVCAMLRRWNAQRRSRRLSSTHARGCDVESDLEIKCKTACSDVLLRGLPPRIQNATHSWPHLRLGRKPGLQDSLQQVESCG